MVVVVVVVVVVVGCGRSLLVSGWSWSDGCGHGQRNETMD